MKPTNSSSRISNLFSSVFNFQENTKGQHIYWSHVSPQNVLKWTIIVCTSKTACYQLWSIIIGKDRTSEISCHSHNTEQQTFPSSSLFFARSMTKIVNWVWWKNKESQANRWNHPQCCFAIKAQHQRLYQQCCYAIFARNQ